MGKGHGQGQRTRALPQAWKDVVLFHGILTAVLT